MDDLDYFVANVVGVVGHGDAVIAIAGHADGEVHALQEALLVNAAEDEGAGSVPKYITKPKSDSNAADWPLWHAAILSH